MLVLHAHWAAPRRPEESGRVLFWAEDSTCAQPAMHPGRLPQNPRPKAHPFQTPIDSLKLILRPRSNEPGAASQDKVTLCLPSTRSGPLPSPHLEHSWTLDQETRPVLAPWIINGLWYSLQEALPLLLDLPVLERRNRGLVIAEDASYWRIATTLVLEALAAQKTVPVISPARSGYQARWLPVLDSPRDAQRLAFMEKNMPPVCRAEWQDTELTNRRPRGRPWRAPNNRPRPPQGSESSIDMYSNGETDGASPNGLSAKGGAQTRQPATPHGLLASFLNSLCDALARDWGSAVVRQPEQQAVENRSGENRYADIRQGENHQGGHRLGENRIGENRPNTGSTRPFPSLENQPYYRWLAALFRSDSLIKGSPAQVQSLASGFRAWIRNLHLAGGSTYRIAFRLEPPETQVIDASASGLENPSRDWQLHYLLQARDDPSLLVPADQVWKATGSVLNQLGRRFEQPQEKLLAGLGYAGRLFPPISESLKGKSPIRLDLDTRQAYTFLREAAPVLEEAGFGLLVPPWWNKPGARLGMRLRLKPADGATRENIASGKLSFNKLIQYRWELSLGDTSLTEQEFRALTALKTPLVQIRGQWVQLDPEQVEAAIQFWEKQDMGGQISILEALQMGMNARDFSSSGLPVEDVVTEDWLTDWLERFNQPGKVSELSQPAGLTGELRPYQRFGYSWLTFFRQWGLGALLADDMGLGKTIQTLALLVKEKEKLGSFPSPVLLIAPTSVVTNWEREIRRFSPGLRTLIHQGPSRLRGDAFVQALNSVDVVLTSYVLARQDAEIIQSIHWHAVIVDEAQNIKNPAARQTQVIRKIPAGFRLALTGTPVENRLSELWSIMQFLNPGYLGSREAFRSNFILPIERYNDKESTEKLKRIVSPFILRRVKTDPTVIQDLPEKVEMNVYCNLTEEQATLYEAVVQDAMKKVEESEGIDRRGNVLSMLMQLKQVCNHPVQYLHQGDETSEAALAGWVERSGKLERLVEMLEEILAEGDRALIFSQFAEMGQMLADCLPQALGCPVLFLHGGTPAKARDGMIRRFQEEPSGPPIFILSLKAGGTGLNLTRANHVFHFDRWWNPAVENQATDRAFRIGQNRNVQVHKFVTEGTLEEMIDEMIESKKGLADAIIGGGESWLTELSTTDLRELVELRKG